MIQSTNGERISNNLTKFNLNQNSGHLDTSQYQTILFNYLKPFESFSDGVNCMLQQNKVSCLASKFNKEWFKKENNNIFPLA